jgi:hypothetical protein
MRLRMFIDRIEGNMAVVLMGEDESVKVDMPVKWLPQGIKEGSLLYMNCETDENDTDRRSIKQMMDELGDNP